MTHCCSEPPPEKTRCVSSQVTGDSTAHTVTIKSMGFIPDILASSIGNTKAYEASIAKFQDTVKKLAPGYRLTRKAAFSLEINTKHEPCLMAFEINKVEGGTRSSRTPPGLKTPGGCQPGAFRQLEICGWTDKQRLARELLQPDAFVFPQVARLTADKETRKYSRHHPECSANGGFLLRGSCAKKACPFRLIDQIESGNGKIGYQFPVERQRQFRAVVPDGGGGGSIEAFEVILESKCHTKGRGIAIKNPVAQIKRNPLPSQLAAILKTGEAVD